MITTQLTPLVCRNCKHEWHTETLCHIPISVWVAHIRTLHCPVCRANYRKLSFRTAPQPPDTTTGTPAE